MLFGSLLLGSLLLGSLLLRALLLGPLLLRPLLFGSQLLGLLLLEPLLFDFLQLRPALRFPGLGILQLLCPLLLRELACKPLFVGFLLLEFLQRQLLFTQPRGFLFGLLGALLLDPLLFELLLRQALLLCQFCRFRAINICLRRLFFPLRLFGQTDPLGLFLGLDLAHPRRLGFQRRCIAGVALVLALLGLLDIDRFLLRFLRPGQRHHKVIRVGILGHHLGCLSRQVGCRHGRADALGLARRTLLDGPLGPRRLGRGLRRRFGHGLDHLEAVGFLGQRHRWLRRERGCHARRRNVWRRQGGRWQGRQWGRRRTGQCHRQRRRCARRTESGYAELQQQDSAVQ